MVVFECVLRHRQFVGLCEPCVTLVSPLSRRTTDLSNVDVSRLADDPAHTRDSQKQVVLCRTKVAVQNIGRKFWILCTRSVLLMPLVVRANFFEEHLLPYTLVNVWSKFRNNFYTHIAGRNRLYAEIDIVRSIACSPAFKRESNRGTEYCIPGSVITRYAAVQLKTSC